ncbi:DNA polymerase/3'-5' exonuclease PolX [Mongoliibacter ruber]|uniref:DNA polymerase (Family 10) n=1 Tax=Mongoliibacter ruber TaxID=1750599 RepID=A0A2T0WII9_9BACT|nr:DNA polymerase/3'-5' exonuclease PolX [Mongoliibacter ruber]PRY86533.1 DNA polymerase (family 10) [Mongoliibacter ruber]
MELHDENTFKIRSYQTAVNVIDRGEDISIVGKSIDELQKINGIGKSIAEVIYAFNASGESQYLDELLAKTPTGILEILEVKGLGPKKVKVLWEEMGITSTHELLEACQAGQVAKIKGFGEKTQESIIQALEFKAANMGKWLFADIEDLMQDFGQKLEALEGVNEVTSVGDFARKMEIIQTVEWLVSGTDHGIVLSQISAMENLEQDLKTSSPYKWRGKTLNPEVQLLIHFTQKDKFWSEKLLRTGSKGHLLYPVNENKTLAQIIKEEGKVNSEEEIYQKAELPFIPEELREGFIEFDMARNGGFGNLIQEGDLKGILHNHSTYSDGKHSLRQMAEFCRDEGYEYLGISDHSRTASYAGGLDIDKVTRQQHEIEELNKELAPFKIFKGIESDILTDGSLDYPNDVLASFDFIVASIHSGLSMDRKKATARLLKAIENPYTTILGHPTGRLLLRREGYPVDHKAIIDACAKYDVVIEINANPWRLDLDWRWIQYALEKGVKLSINPDAHEMEGYADMRYGVIVGRKGGLTKDMTFNAMDLKSIENYLEERKSKIK